LRSAKLQAEYTPYFPGRWNAVGIFSHHLTYGGVCLFIFSIFTPLAFSPKLSVKSRLLYAAGASINLVALILTFGRSSWLGAGLSLAVIIAFSLNRKLLITLILIAGISVSGFWLTDNQLKQYLLTSTSIGKRFAQGLSLQANKDRLLMWKAGWQVISDNPILGLGPKMGEEIVPYYQKIAKEFNHRYQHQPSVGLHNIYIQTWIDFGILGLLGYLLWMFSVIFQSIKKIWSSGIRASQSNVLLLGLSAGLAGSMLAGFFENNFRDGEVQSIILTFMGMTLALLYPLGKPVSRPHKG